MSSAVAFKKSTFFKTFFFSNLIRDQAPDWVQHFYRPNLNSNLSAIVSSRIDLQRVEVALQTVHLTV